MPRKVQYTKEQIVQVAIDIIRKDGTSALSSRSISKALGCSISPIFRTYSSMEELMDDVRKKAEKIFIDYVSDVYDYTPAFKEFGMRLIRFSKMEPNLFFFMFLDMGSKNDSVDEIARKCLHQIIVAYGITMDQAEYLYSQTWPFVLGLAQLCNKNPGIFTKEYVSLSLSMQFAALLTLIKSGGGVLNIEPRLIPEGERVFLRRWHDSDTDELFALASDPDVGPRAGWKPHTSIEESSEIIRRYLSNPGTFAIVLKETGAIVGCIGYHIAAKSNIPIAPDENEVGYWIAKPYWNRGLCTEALGLLIEHCKRLKMFRNMYGTHFLDNPASGRVMEKCGFTDTGVRRNCPSLAIGSDKEVRVMKLEISSAENSPTLSESSS